MKELAEIIVKSLTGNLSIMEKDFKDLSSNDKLHYNSHRDICQKCTSGWKRYPYLKKRDVLKDSFIGLIGECISSDSKEKDLNVCSNSYIFIVSKKSLKSNLLDISGDITVFAKLAHLLSSIELSPSDRESYRYLYLSGEELKIAVNSRFNFLVPYTIYRMMFLIPLPDT